MRSTDSISGSHIHMHFPQPTDHVACNLLWGPTSHITETLIWIHSEVYYMFQASIRSSTVVNNCLTPRSNRGKSSSSGFSLPYTIHIARISYPHLLETQWKIHQNYSVNRLPHLALRVVGTSWGCTCSWLLRVYLSNTKGLLPNALAWGS